MKNIKPLKLPDPDQALPGRANPMPVLDNHFVNNTPVKGPFPETMEVALFGLGCFWGAERKFWELNGVYTTAVGYSAGYTPNPTYQEVCSGQTGHNEVVFVVFDPTRVSYQQLLQLFWESHNPTQTMRQGNDIGTQYRSGIYTYSDSQAEHAKLTKQAYQSLLEQNNQGKITTEILPATEFYYAEEYHQQYLAKNPNGYCGLGGLGIAFT